MIPVSFDGVTFAGRGLGYGLIRALPGEERAPIWRMRRGGDPATTGITRGARLVRIQFYNPPEGGDPDDEDIEARLLTLLGELDLTNDEPRALVVELTTDDDGDGLADTVREVTVNAVVGAYTWMPGGLKGVEVTFHVVSGLWEALTATTVGPTTVGAGSYGGLSPTIGGTAPAFGTVRLEPTASDQQVTVRTFSITNDGSRTMENFPVRVDLGDTYDGLAHPSYYFALLKDGVRQRCQLINYYGRNIAYLWLVVDHLPAGETADYTLLLSDTFLMPGTAFNSYTQPAFDTTAEARQVTTGSTTTVFEYTGVAWETNQWRGGMLRVLDGAMAGEEHTIVSNDADSITVVAFTGAPASSTRTLITMSANGKWVYPVRQTERSDSRRGLWWINQGQKKPGDARFDVPGAWAPYLYYDNDDVKNQSPWFGVNVGTFDYFATLDADRSFPGGSSLLDNGADGVSLTMPFPMTFLKFTHQLKNPNGMATFVVGSREAGGSAEFIHEYSNAAQLSTLTNQSEQTLALTADTIQLYLGLIPTTISSMVEEEIGTRWAGDEGTATSGSSVALNDTTKAWIPDQWIGATVIITSGTGAGQQVAITDNTATQLTATFATAPDSTSRYVIRQQRGLVATVRTNDVFELTWDASDLTISAVSAPADGYLLNRTLYIDRATSSADPPYQRVQFDPDDTSRYIVLTSGETFVLSGEEQRAWIEDSGGVEVRAVPPYAVRVHDVEADGTERLAERWLWLTPGAHTLNLSAEADGNEYDMSLTYTSAYFG